MDEVHKAQDHVLGIKLRLFQEIDAAVIVDIEIADIDKSLVQLAQKHAHQGVVLIHVFPHLHQHFVGYVIDAQSSQFVIQITHQFPELAFGDLIIELHDNRLVQAGIQAHHKYILAVADRKHIQLGQISVGYFGFCHKTKLIRLPGQQLHDVMERQGRVFVMLDQHLAQQVHAPECHLVVLGSYHLQIVPVALDGRNPARRGVRLIDQVLLFQLHQIQAQRGRAHLL